MEMRIDTPRICLDPRAATFDQTVFDQAAVATYLTHADAETAVRLLAGTGFPLNQISIVGRHFETHQDIQGFYRPADAALDGAGQGAWYGGLFGLLLGAMGFFVMPAVGAFLVLGPLSGMIAGAVGGAGVGALINGLVTSGVPRDAALKYQERLQAGEFLVVVHGNAGEAARAQELLAGTAQTYLQAHTTMAASNGRAFLHTRL